MSKHIRKKIKKYIFLYILDFCIAMDWPVIQSVYINSLRKMQACSVTVYLEAKYPPRVSKRTETYSMENITGLMRTINLWP